MMKISWRWNLSSDESYNCQRSEKEWWLVTFRLWRCFFFNLPAAGKWQWLCQIESHRSPCEYLLASLLVVKCVNYFSGIWSGRICSGDHLWPGPSGIPGYPGIPGLILNPDPGILENLIPGFFGIYPIKQNSDFKDFYWVLTQICPKNPGMKMLG